MNELRLSDEILSAYIDGELDQQTRSAVDKRLADDAGARARLDQLDRVNSLVQQAFHSPSTEIQTVAGRTSKGALLPWIFGPSLIAASLVGLVIGLNLQQVSAVSMETPLLGVADRLEQSSLFQTTMEGELSGSKIRWSDVSDASAILTPVRSFRLSSGSYCRQFELIDATAKMEGVVCRQSRNDWQVEELSYLKPQEGVRL